MVAPSLRALGTVTSGSTTSPSFAAPAGAASTDVILILFFEDDGRTTISGVPSGFTLCGGLRQVNDASAGAPSHSLYGYWGRFADVGAGPYGFTVNPGAGGTPFIEGRAAAIQDCITTGDPFEATNGATSGNTNVTTAPSVSATSAGTDRYAIYAATNWASGAWTPPSGFVEQWDANTRIITFDDQTLATAQTVTPQAVCASSSRSNAWVGILLPIASAAAAPLSPIVATSTTPPTGSRPLVLRSTLADPPVLTTASPYVVTTPASARPARPILARGSLADRYTTASPYVVTHPAAGRRSTAILARAAAAPAAVVSGPAVQPMVVTATGSGPAGLSVLLRPGPQPGVSDPITHRPNAGTTARPSTGITLRPNTGVTARP